MSRFRQREFDSSISQTTSVCQGEIKMAFPGSVGNCLKNTLKMCENGTTVDLSFLMSLSSAGQCAFSYLVNTAPKTVLMSIACDISKSAASVFGSRNPIASLFSMASKMLPPTFRAWKKPDDVPGDVIDQGPAEHRRSTLKSTPNPQRMQAPGELMGVHPLAVTDSAKSSLRSYIDPYKILRRI
ncbi:uncharacterized protein LOC144102169 [Amblyomma americanum]